MENQKIQQLIRLASIADNNGDYKIADKLFNKIAALPPLFPNTHTPEMIDKYLANLLKDVTKLQTDMQFFQKFVRKFKDPEFKLFAEMDQAKLTAAFQDYQNSLIDIKKWQTQRTQSLKDYNTAKSANDTATMSTKEAEIAILDGNIDAAEKSIDGFNYKEFFGDLRKPPLPYKETLQKIEDLKDELEKLIPDPEALASQKIDVNKLTSFFSKINTDKARRALEKLNSSSRTPQTPDIQGVINKFNSLISKAKTAVRNNPDLTETPNNIYIEMEKIDGKFIKSSGLNRDDIIKFIEDNRIDPDKIMAIKSISKLKQFFTYLPGKARDAYEEFVKLRSERKAIPKQHPFNSPQAIKAYTSGVWDVSKSQIYDKHFVDFIKQLDLRLAEEYAKQVEKIKIRDKAYSASNPKQFDEAFTKAQQSLAKNCPEAIAITNLFASMKDNFKVLQETAERILIRKGKISKPKENTQAILAKMIELDKRFMKTTGLSDTSIDKLILNDDLTLADFLELDGKKLIPNIKNETFLLILAALGVSVYGFADPLVIPKTLEFLRKKIIPSAYENRTAPTKPQAAPKPPPPSTSGLDAFNKM